jgi:hypothetical protein
MTENQKFLIAIRRLLVGIGLAFLLIAGVLLLSCCGG